MEGGLKRISESPIIAVIRGVPEQKTLKVMEALVLGGVRNMEITFGSNNTEGVIKQTRAEFGDEVMVGAGTVLTTEQVKVAVESGAQFIFSPNYSERVVRLAIESEVISIPGAMTPTEIYQAYEVGAHAVKLFPANVVGTEFIKGLKDPLPEVPIVPTGGINKENITSYFNAGALAVGIGSSLIDQQAIYENNFSKLTQNAKEFVAKVQQFQNV